MSKIIKRILFWVLFLLALFALTEWASYSILSHKLPGYDNSVSSFNIGPSGYTVYHFNPNHQFTLNNKPIEGVKTDSFGFIHPYGQLSKDKPENTKRIFLCGGSAMAGFGQSAYFDSIRDYNLAWHPYAQSIAGYLEKQLNNEFDSLEVQVINAATFGWQIHHSYHRYLELIQHFEPDLIVNMDGFNDALGIAIGNPYPIGEVLYQEMINQFWQLDKPVTPFHSLNLLYTFFRINKPDQKVSIPLASYTLPLDEGYYKNHKERIVRNSSTTSKILKHYAASLQRDSVAFLFAVQPIVYSMENKALSSTEKAFAHIVHYRSLAANPAVNKLLRKHRKSYFSDSNVMAEQLVYQYAIADTLSASWKSTVEKEGGVYLNLQEQMTQLPDNMEFYLDPCHLTREANAFVARKFAEIIITRHLLNQ